MDESDVARFNQGLQVRKLVLGDDYVERALSAVDDFTSDLQHQVTADCWGNTWRRPGLDRKTRSIITMAALVARGHSSELKAHTLGALRNGCTPTEVREVLMHLIPYVGFPAVIEAFRAAQEVVGAWQEPNGDPYAAS